MNKLEAGENVSTFYFKYFNFKINIQTKKGKIGTVSGWDKVGEYVFCRQYIVQKRNFNRYKFKKKG